MMNKGSKTDNKDNAKYIQEDKCTIIVYNKTR